MSSLELKIPPVVVTLICGILIWILNQLVAIESLVFYAPWWGYGLFLIAGIAIVILGVAEFGKHATTTHPRQPEKATALVRSGIYSISRNPMYLGLLLILLACVIYSGNLATLVMLPLFTWYMSRFQIIPEERIMLQKFGADYREYQSKVRRWI